MSNIKSPPNLQPFQPITHQPNNICSISKIKALPKPLKKLTLSLIISLMTSFRLLLLLILSSLTPILSSQSILRTFLEQYTIIKINDDLYCDSWRFSVETNDAGIWRQVPARCIDFVEDYMTGDRYPSDSGKVGEDSLLFASTVEITGDGKDIWVFDVDETLLSNLPYYALNGFGSQIFEESTFNEWVSLAEAPALPASLKLYKELQGLGFKVVLLTGRDESQRNVTKKNLLFAGFSDWERLILRGPSDRGTTAVIYKSEKRMQLEAEGYRIHGSSGDQWSDLYGSPMATRSFKLPNPMYYIA